MPPEIKGDHAKLVRRALRGYIRDHFDHDMGELQTDLLLEFMVGLIGATVYNQAIDDAQAYMQGKVIDLEIDLHEEVEYEGKGEGERGDREGG